MLQIPKFGNLALQRKAKANLKSIQKRSIVLEITQVTDFNSKDFAEASQIYLESFPANETRPIEKTKSLLVQGNYKLYVVKEDKVIGIALVYFFDDFGSFDYMAITPQYQRKGIGTKLFLYVCDISRSKNHDLLFLEVQREKQGEPNRQDRIRLYQSLGAKLVIDNYLMPSYQTEAEQMNLMVMPQKNQDSISKKDLERYIREIYQNVYSHKDSDLLEKISKTLPEKIMLGEIKIN